MIYVLILNPILTIYLLILTILYSLMLLNLFLLHILGRNDLRLWLHLLRRCFTFNFCIVLINILLYLEVISILFFEFIPFALVDFSYSIYHIFAHIFGSKHLKNFSWQCLELIVRCMNKMAEIPSITSVWAMKIFTWNGSIISNFDFSICILFLSFLLLQLLLLRLFILFNELFNQVLKLCNGLSMLKFQLNVIHWSQVVQISIPLSDITIDSIIYLKNLVYSKNNKIRKLLLCLLILTRKWMIK